MKKIILIASMLIVSLTSFAGHPTEMKANLKELRNGIAAYMASDADYKTIKSAPVTYDATLDMAEVSFKCPGIWKGTTVYVAYGIEDVMIRYANIKRVTDWAYDEEYIWTEYQCDVDYDFAYTIMVNYYRKTNIMVITMYEKGK